MRYLSIDIETTSTDTESAKIIQFGCVLEDTTKNIPVTELPSLEVIINQPYKGDPVALDMNQAIFNRMPAEGISQGIFLRIFTEFLKKNDFTIKDGRYEVICAGKNFGSFDMQILNNIPGFKTKFRLKSRILDPAILYVDKNDTDLPDLLTCLQRAGIDKIVEHTAKADARDVISLIRKSGIFTRKNCNCVTL
ncbi:MAG: exonuclease domain-containing protein [Bacteroidales bacterium]|jgi:hypothetical protein|nr:exonuclease domain-containing protein [Bacteroidales bacterium]